MITVTAKESREWSEKIRELNRLFLSCDDYIIKSIFRAIMHGRDAISVKYDEKENKSIKEELESKGFTTNIIKTRFYDELIIRW